MVRTIVVTGGGGGLGKAIAARFRAEGDDVIITGRRADVLEQTAKTIGARALAFDAADPLAVTAALAQLPAAIDVLVNNAGGNTSIVSPAPTDLERVAVQWQENYAANVLTAVLMTTALSPRLRSGGAVISFSSIAADKGAGPYGAAKAALASWNIDLSRELGSRDITANVIAPGFIDGTDFFHGTMTASRRETLRSAAALGRVGQPADIAGTAFFLASPDARFITGQVIAVNGGAMVTR